MTGNEIAAELVRRQGYLAFRSSRPFVIGEVVPLHKIQEHSTPTRVIGPSNFAEYAAQCYLVDEMNGEEYSAPEEGGFYYRCEAAD